MVNIHNTSYSSQYPPQKNEAGTDQNSLSVLKNTLSNGISNSQLAYNQVKDRDFSIESIINTIKENPTPALLFSGGIGALWLANKFKGNKPAQPIPEQPPAAKTIFLLGMFASMGMIGSALINKFSREGFETAKLRYELEDLVQEKRMRHKSRRNYDSLPQENRQRGELSGKIDLSKIL